MRAALGFNVLALSVLVVSSGGVASEVTGAAQSAEIYVYSDRGACEDGCAEAVGEVLDARSAKYKYANRASITEKSLSSKKLWIQPGGDGIEMALYLKERHKQTLRNFVLAGGSYLGFCAGAFLADHFVDDANTIPGLGFIPGSSRDYSPINKNEMILAIIWNYVRRYMYFQDGATFDLISGAEVHTIARYPTGEAAVIEFMYGKGRVILSGVHPEANDTWREKLIDPDGDDTYLAQELIDKLL